MIVQCDGKQVDLDRRSRQSMMNSKLALLRILLQAKLHRETADGVLIRQADVPPGTTLMFYCFRRMTKRIPVSFDPPDPVVPRAYDDVRMRRYNLFNPDGRMRRREPIYIGVCQHDDWEPPAEPFDDEPLETWPPKWRCVDELWWGMPNYA